VLAPTRELAIQVAEAFQSYAAHMKDFHVLPIYGGQSYGPQLSALRRGVHVVVGTPGRVIDHLEKGSLDLSQLKTLVLDEADEMLRMGFIDDVEQILQKRRHAPDRAVLGHHAVGDQAHRQDLPARPGRSHGRRQDRHRRQHPPALLAGVAACRSSKR
jgi:superfamily II DNA/RNA helicase